MNVGRYLRGEDRHVGTARTELKMDKDDRAKFEALTDEQIIAIKKSTKCSDPYKPWGDTLAFARAILATRTPEPQAETASQWVEQNVSGNPALMQAMKNHAEAAEPQPDSRGQAQEFNKES